MVGICGAIGATSRDLDALLEGLTWTGEETVAQEVTDDLAVAVATHPMGAAPEPARTAERDATVWAWGDVWTVETPDGHEPVEGPAAQTIARLYDRDGRAAVGQLNGSFAALIHNRDAGTVQLLTDRMGTRPIHRVRTDGAEGGPGLVFSTDIQSLARHPDVTTAIDVEYFAEYVTLQRTFGLKTPLQGVERLPPGSITTVHFAGDAVATERYWEPRYEPSDRPRRYYADRLASLLVQVVSERTDPDETYGLLLSGGSDSRLTLAALTAAGRDVHAYHLNEWRNPEERVAHRAAAIAGAEFTFLRRDREYPARVLERTAPITNFVGYFNQVHAAGYTDRLRNEVDVLVTGLYGDLCFKGNALPTRTVELGGLCSVHLPVSRSVRTLSDLVDARVDGRTAPAYLEDALDRSVHEIYAANVERRGDRIVDHGVEYRSLEEAIVASRCPLSNGTSQAFYHGTLQMLPSWTPFLDDRLVDLFLETPRRYLLRGGLVGAALERLAPDLAALPHPSSGVALSRPFTVQWLGKQATGFADRYVRDTPQKPHWTYGPWPDHGALIREEPFVRETLEAAADHIAALPFLDAAGIDACYRAHCEGEHNLAALYTLVTFLSMPLVETLTSSSESLSTQSTTDD